MPPFPSLAWFQALRDLVNADPAFRRFGAIDCDMGLALGDATYRVRFEAFEVVEVAKLADPTSADLDFTLHLSPARWRELLQHITANGAAPRDWTLNTLDLQDPDNFARSDDYLRRDKFYRSTGPSRTSSTPPPASTPPSPTTRVSPDPVHPEPPDRLPPVRPERGRGRRTGRRPPPFGSPSPSVQME